MASSDSTGLFVGLDIGSTTSSMLVARAQVVRNVLTGQSEIGNVQPVFCPEPVFTPFLDETLDRSALANQLESWMGASGLAPASLAAGGALVTGLAARAANAASVARLVRARFHEVVVARADDPCLESWLAFMGNTSALSRGNPERLFINLDIGGGTTNIAWGQNGEVRRCGCYFVGARHIRVQPGTYFLTSLSEFARDLLAGLNVCVPIGSELPVSALTAVLDFYVGMLEAAVTGGALPGPEPAARGHTQVEFEAPPDDADRRPILTLSGGVGELAYRCARKEPLPGTTAFGDLGIDLARRLSASPILGRDLTTHLPAALGRATVCGLARHSAEISGATLFLPCPELLPLDDLPILGSISADSTMEEMATLVRLAAVGSGGACLRIRGDLSDAARIKHFGMKLSAVVEKATFPAAKPLVLLVAGNCGRTLGQYATRWGRLPITLIVLDELPDRPAHLASIGRPFGNILPVAFHGWGARTGP